MVTKYQSDVVIIGGGLAGLVTAFELLDHGKSVLILDRDEASNLGGLAKKAFGGIMFVGSPEQRKLGIHDTPEMALSDWHAFASFGEEDQWPQRWAETYVHRSVELIYNWLKARGLSFLPLINWAERGLFHPGNSVPRWHITWGTGSGIIRQILEHMENHPKFNHLTIQFDHCVTDLILTNGAVTGCRGHLENSKRPFEAQSDVVVVASGGIGGGDLSFIKKHWPKDFGQAPTNLLNGAHQYGDGTVHKAVGHVGGQLTHLDQHWLYAGGIHHPDPVRPNDGLSIIPPRSALWVNARGERIGPVPLVSYTDTRHLVSQISHQPGQYSWQILNMKIALKELAVSGSAHNDAFRERDRFKLLKNLFFGNRSLVDWLIDSCEDVIAADTLPELVYKMNAMPNPFKVDGDRLNADIKAYDDQIARGPAYYNDHQLRWISQFQKYKGDRIRTCKFQQILDPKARPLIAIREFLLTRKSLGGIQTNLQGQVLTPNGTPLPGLFAVGEAAGYGGGGIHGKGSLEGTFLGCCVLTGRLAGVAIGTAG